MAQEAGCKLIIRQFVYLCSCMRLTLKLKGALLALLAFVSCGTPRLGIYSIHMEDVFCVPESENKNLMFSTRGLADGTTEYTYQDSFIQIGLVLTNTRFAFKMKNLLPDTLFVDWEKAKYINQHGDTLRVIHNGVDLAQRTRPQDTTFLAPGTLLEDFLLPVDNIIDEPTNFSLWKINYLFYEKRDNVGQKVSVILPLETKEGEKRYHFLFVIDNWKDM
jgi:hypothetical protein